MKIIYKSGEKDCIPLVKHIILGTAFKFPKFANEKSNWNAEPANCYFLLA